MPLHKSVVYTKQLGFTVIIANGGIIGIDFHQLQILKRMDAKITDFVNETGWRHSYKWASFILKLPSISAGIVYNQDWTLDSGL